MADIVTPEVRSRMMAGIGPKDTKPEMMIRRGLHALGYRYRLHDRKLPGRPDLVFPGLRAVILIHGCFWHGHACSLFRWPGTRPEFWREKVSGNIARDARVRAQLLEAGWRVLEVWECSLRGRDRQAPEAVLDACATFLNGDNAFVSIGVDRTVATMDQI
ncbi:very short patch repair endonuclease [uncultured Brevundimonas sp.]|uniref:very short patch repair endonuclease n=1 Tax=uncultured Brevundimonas sp. TaxID=213418 RepID=UPI0025E81BD2|nr:very short patch repair endonuclease [uncultured Brevundimonas sp.]